MSVDYSLPKPTAGSSRATSPTESEIMADISDTIADIGTRLDAVESGASLTSARVTRTAGNVAINNNTGFSTVTGMECSIAAEAGDVLEVGINLQCANEAVNLNLDVGTVVASAVVNRISGSTSATQGVPGWHVRGSNYFSASGTRQYVVQAGDVSGGTVTLRLLASTESASNRTIHATTATPAQMHVKNLR